MSLSEQIVADVRDCMNVLGKNAPQEPTESIYKTNATV